MARRRRKRSAKRTWLVLFAVIAAVLGYGWFTNMNLKPTDKPRVTDAEPPIPSATITPEEPGQLTATRDEPVSKPPAPVARIQPPPPARDHDAPAPQQPTPRRTDGATGADLFKAGLAAMDRGNWIDARQVLTRALAKGLPDQQARQARSRLIGIAEQTIFSSAVIDGDPLVRRHVVQPGETLGRIAKRYHITDNLIARINNIGNKNMIRVGQTLKVVVGPFHAVIDKKSFSMDLYVQDTLVHRYAVGLGVNDNTPTGDWVVGSKLTNPTYYPARGGKIVAADDPDNPLGEYWIALVGVGGDAVGQQRYGIHGTNEPDSIGKNMSLGCVRMHNEDVAEVYSMLVPRESTVRIHD